MMNKTLLCLVAIFLSGECVATCYTVFNKSDEPVYRSEDPPFDFSLPISQGLSSKYPGGYLIQSETDCPPLPPKGDLDFNLVNKEIKQRAANSKPGQVEVHIQSDKNVDHENAARLWKETVKESAKTTGLCGNFKYFWGDEIGKNLADAARVECLNNEALKKMGGVGSDNAYNEWRHHHNEMSKQRQANMQNAQNAEANRKLGNELRDIKQNQRQITRDQQSIDETVKDIRNTQRYGY